MEDGEYVPAPLKTASKGGEERRGSTVCCDIVLVGILKMSETIC